MKGEPPDMPDASAGTQDGPTLPALLRLVAQTPLPIIEVGGAPARIHTQGQLVTGTHIYVTGRLGGENRRGVLLRYARAPSMTVQRSSRSPLRAVEAVTRGDVRSRRVSCSRTPMRHLALSIPALVLTSSATALATSLPPGEVAVARKPEVRAAGPAQVDPPRPTDFLVMAFTGGPVFVPGRGWGGFARGGSELLICQNAEGTGPLYGVTSMWEGYTAPASRGLSTAVGWTAGFATRRLLATTGFGLNIFSFDMLNEKGGVGLLSPRANVRLGVRVGPRLSVAASAEMQYRWRMAIEAQRIFGLGLSLLYVADKSARR